MDFKENKEGGTSGEYHETSGVAEQSIMIKDAPEFEDEEGEDAYGIYSGDALLGVCWNKDLADAFKEAAEKVNLRMK